MKLPAFFWRFHTDERILRFKKLRFNQYVYGQPLQIVTDHKLRLGLLHEHKTIPSMAASRTQKGVIVLSAYNYELIFKSGRKHKNC